MKRVILVLAETTGAPPHFPLCCKRGSIQTGFGEVAHDEDGESLSHLPPPPVAPSEPTLRWKRLGSETLDIEEPVNLQQILVNHAFLSHATEICSPKYGLAHLSPGQLVPNYTKAFISLVSIM